MPSYQTTDAVMKRVEEVFPSSVLRGAIKHLVNPCAFQAEFAQKKHYLNQYFSHISVATPADLELLTVTMPEKDMTEELELIVAKILLNMQRLLGGSSPEDDLKADDEELLPKLYFRTLTIG